MNFYASGAEGRGGNSKRKADPDGEGSPPGKLLRGAHRLASIFH